MINLQKTLRLVSFGAAATAFLLVSGGSFDTQAQARDPFAKPGWARQRDPRMAKGGPSAGPATNLAAPDIQQRIDYYKRLRETAAASGHPLPKVTSVLTLGELAVTGIFRTPRGYAAIVEATPIKLSYTIYPGERFFDGQLVAVEENRLVFRRVTKMSNGKFVSSVENKALRQYTDRQTIQGTGPSEAELAANQRGEQPQPAAPAAGSDGKPVVAPVKIVSPLEEMNKQVPGEKDTQKSKKDAKKPVKVARNK
jgi:hypothetical protein